MAFEDDETMRKKWKAFYRKIDTKTDDFAAVLKKINGFLAEPFTAVVDGKKLISEWSASDCKWT